MMNPKITVIQCKDASTIVTAGTIPAVKETLCRDLINLRDKGFYAALIICGLGVGKQWTVFFEGEPDDVELMKVSEQFVNEAKGETNEN